MAWVVPHSVSPVVFLLLDSNHLDSQEEVPVFHPQWADLASPVALPQLISNHPPASHHQDKDHQVAMVEEDRWRKFGIELLKFWHSTVIGKLHRQNEKFGMARLRGMANILNWRSSYEALRGFKMASHSAKQHQLLR